jgi:hypothetical protein
MFHVEPNAFSRGTFLFGRMSTLITAVNLSVESDRSNGMRDPFERNALIKMAEHFFEIWKG